MKRNFSILLFVVFQCILILEFWEPPRPIKEWDYQTKADTHVFGDEKCEWSSSLRHLTFIRLMRLLLNTLFEVFEFSLYPAEAGCCIVTVLLKSFHSKWEIHHRTSSKIPFLGHSSYRDEDKGEEVTGSYYKILGAEQFPLASFVCSTLYQENCWYGPSLAQSVKAWVWEILTTDQKMLWNNNDFQNPARLSCCCLW